MSPSSTRSSLTRLGPRPSRPPPRRCTCVIPGRLSSSFPASTSTDIRRSSPSARNPAAERSKSCPESSSVSSGGATSLTLPLRRSPRASWRRRLTPLSSEHDNRFPGESAEYRRERNRLLEAEVDLRRAVERVAAQRRALPPGGVVPEDYVFERVGGAPGEISLSALFAP